MKQMNAAVRRSPSSFHDGLAGGAIAGVRPLDGARGMWLVGHDGLIQIGSLPIRSCDGRLKLDVWHPIFPKSARTSENSSNQTCRAM
jgi:hypothetical protein